MQDPRANLAVEKLRCEYKVNPIGIDVTRPRLSWQIGSSRRGVVQAAYQIRVAESEDALATPEALLWDSGQVPSGESIHRVYRGPALRSRQRCCWQVRVWDEDGPSDWSRAATWEMGLLAPEDWQASWIQAGIEEDTSTSPPCPMLRTTFRVDGAVARARAYITSLGLYEAELNGGRVGDQVFTPGWTLYDVRLQYQTYDVGHLLVEGENAVGATLGDGWYRGNLGFEGQRNVYGEKLSLLVQLEIVYRDGRTQTVCTDDTWRSATGPILASDIYNGESYDARLEKPGWSRAGYDDGAWSGVRAFYDEFVTSRGRVANNTQTAYVLALMFDLLPEQVRPEAARRLVADIRQRGTHISTGFAGTPYLCHVLSRTGHLDVAYDLLNQDTYPSWIYPVTQGATTIWERWDGQRPDGSFQDAGMNSFNHYAYGAIGDWMYRVAAGIEIDPHAPGYKHALIQPRPGGGLTCVSATLDSMYGTVSSAWQVIDGGFALSVSVPPNTTATVRLPAAELGQVAESGLALDRADGIERAYQDGDDVVVTLGSGSYAFAYPYITGAIA